MNTPIAIHPVAGMAVSLLDRGTVSRAFLRGRRWQEERPRECRLWILLHADGVFVGSGIFKSGDPVKRANAIVQATLHFDNPDEIAKASRGLGEAMVGINVADIPVPHRLAERGW